MKLTRKQIEDISKYVKSVLLYQKLDNGALTGVCSNGDPYHFEWSLRFKIDGKWTKTMKEQMLGEAKNE